MLGIALLRINPKNKAKSIYKKRVKQIAGENNFDFELKASNLKDYNHRNSLYKVLRQELTFSVAIDNHYLKDYIVQDKKSRQRFKDYAISRIIKKLFNKLISHGYINCDDDIELFLNIDQQGFATNGLYGLGDGIFEELHEGIYNFSYGKFFKPILTGDFKVCTKSCVSENDYLIQAADILANRIWNSYTINDYNLRIIPNHTYLKLP
ncbi:Uncharacterised protein [Streptococcus porcinus]|uniref:DUF3800 domain-containing protein n=1 Tax=Streptococcus porcinus TaxID=1340 RepID=UPI0010CAB639|nr:DUF3800 domain-containing protein [Streptococcus porcinus]VTS33429.1 Uncharacterised protein [Streptococcus porcinus]